MLKASSTFLALWLRLAAGAVAGLVAMPSAFAAIAPGPFGASSKLLNAPIDRPAASRSAAAVINGSTAPTKPTLELGCADLRRNALRMSAHASNLMNRETTRTPQGGAYKRLEVICKAAGGAFCNVETATDTVRRYLPGHPDADPTGYVTFPSINAGSESAGLNLAASELKVLAKQGICGAKGIEDGQMMIVKYDSDFDVMMDTMTFTADGRVARWSRTTRDGRTQNLTFKDDGTPVGI
ncbi:hypothetical protein BH10BDE1_BH10BDE1_10800 [soil metagenome]